MAWLMASCAFALSGGKSKEIPFTTSARQVLEEIPRYLPIPEPTSCRVVCQDSVECARERGAVFPNVTRKAPLRSCVGLLPSYPAQTCSK